MKNIKILSTTEELLERSSESKKYTSYEDKRMYYSAIETGNADLINELCTKNYEYPSKVFERFGSYSEALEEYRHEASCAAAEFCLVALQGGVPDMVAYDIRDRYIKDIDKAVALPDIFFLLHGMAYDFARRVQLAKESGVYSSKVRGMMMFIEQNLQETITLEDVAKAVDISRTYASALFRENVGITMNEFILKERLSEAKRMLKSGEYTVSEIAERLQFCSPSYFTKCFREQEGLSPQKYRTNV